jgi:CxxC-x17-CxxC domain-containing protein
LELCYKCIDCNDSYHLLFSELCNNCSFSSFCFDCIGCQSCFLCTNLRNKKYCFRNEQLSKEEYEKRLPDLSSRATVEKFRTEFEERRRKAIHREHQNVQVEQCTGNYLKNCKDCRDCFDVHNAEGDIRCTDAVTGSAYCSDCSYVTMECEWDYECAVCSNATSNCSFCVGCRDGNSHLLYCDTVYGSRDCFGCVGIKRKRHCILNRQYTKEEYERLVPQIIRHMRRTGEWGEFFPAVHSVYDYNETMAVENFPLSRAEALKQGFRWRDAPDEVPKVAKIIPSEQLPDNIADIPDDILNWAIRCPATQRPFKLVKQELDFYRMLKLPVPRLHPDERHRRRMALRNPRKLWTRKCAKCGKDMQTTYAPERPETVYCEECYLKEVY